MRGLTQGSGTAKFKIGGAKRRDVENRVPPILNFAVPDPGRLPNPNLERHQHQPAFAGEPVDLQGEAEVFGQVG